LLAILALGSPPDPPRHADSFALVVKGLKLHSDITAFLRRYSREPHSLKWVHRRGAALTPRVYISSAQVLRARLDIATLRQSFPSELRTQADKPTVDGELLSALWLIDR